MELPHIQHGCGVKRLRCQWSRPGGVAQHPFSDADPDSLRHEQIPTVLLGVRTHQAAPGGKSDQLNEQWEQMIRIQKIDIAKFVSRLLTTIVRVGQYGKGMTDEVGMSSTRNGRLQNLLADHNK